MEDRKGSTNSHRILPQRRYLRSAEIRTCENQTVRSISLLTSRFRHTQQLHRNEVGLNRHRGRAQPQASESCDHSCPFSLCSPLPVLFLDSGTLLSGFSYQRSLCLTCYPADKKPSSSTSSLTAPQACQPIENSSLSQKELLQS